MRKLIINILNEGDFDWVGDVNILRPDGKYAIIITEYLTSEEHEKLFNYLGDIGFDGDSNGPTRIDFDTHFINRYSEEGGFVLYISDEGIGWDKLIDLDPERHDDVLTISDILKIIDGIPLNEDKDWDFMDMDNITIIEALESILEGTQFSVVLGEYENDEGDMEDIIRLNDGNVTLSSLPYQNYDIKMENVDKLLEFIILHLESRVSIENNIINFGISNTSKQLSVVIGLIKDYMGDVG